MAFKVEVLITSKPGTEGARSCGRRQQDQDEGQGCMRDQNPGDPADRVDLQQPFQQSRARGHSRHFVRGRLRAEKVF